MPRSVAAPLLGALLLAGGCAGVDRSTGQAYLLEGRYADARAFHEALLVDEPRDAALDHDEAGVMALLEGDVPGANRHFREAFDDLEDLSASTAETIGAMAGSSRSRRWKGDPYERCMNAYYLGVTYWLLGDEDNAAASFRAGVLRDADSAEGTSQSDFALLWYLLGQAQRAASHQDRGDAALARARELRPDNAWTDPAKARGGNVLLVIETGLGPQRIASGPHGSVVRFRARPGATRAANVRVGGSELGRELGRAEPLGDIYRQAITRGDKVIDHVNQGKAVFKDAAVIGGAVVLHNAGSRQSQAVGAALIAAGLLLQAETDLRTWTSLPDDVLVLVADLPPGQHDLELTALDAEGRALPGTQWTVPVDVLPHRVQLVWTRTLPPAAGVARTARPASSRWRR